MPKKKGTIEFHGAYGTKAKAVRKERKVKGFIRRVRVRGSIRYVVMKRKG